MMRILLLGLLAACSVHAAPTGEIRRVLLAQHDVDDMPGWETRLYLIEYPPGASAPPHTHPATGVGYVLEGRFESQFDGETPTFGEQGQAFVDKTGVIHVRFRNADPDRTLRFVIAYTIRRGEQPLHPVAKR
jgi:quercetin dioxygenase-like cupin family protein